jgi:hypothetical protein
MEPSKKCSNFWSDWHNLRKLVCFFLLLTGMAAQAQQTPENFRWIDFHSPKDQDVVVWVTRSLEPEKWTAIREIAVEYDAALVVTTLRANPQAAPENDTFTVWSLSLTNHSVLPLISGVNLRWLDWLLLAEGRPRELAALYDSCRDCAADTYLTAFAYNLESHGWAARWMRGSQAVSVWTAKPPAGVDLTQLYAVLAEPNGRQVVATWSHLDYGPAKDSEDFIYRYDLDPFSTLERTMRLANKEAEAMKARLCSAQATLPGLARGQDAPLCHIEVKQKSERHPVTTPPTNNHGRSEPPGSGH